MAFGLDTIVGFSQFLLLALLVAVWTELIDQLQRNQLPQRGLLLVMFGMYAVDAVLARMVIFGGGIMMWEWGWLGEDSAIFGSEEVGLDV